MKKVEILLVDDHKIVRDGLRMILSTNEEFDFVVSEADCGERA